MSTIHSETKKTRSDQGTTATEQTWTSSSTTPSSPPNPTTQSSRSKSKSSGRKATIIGGVVLLVGAFLAFSVFSNGSADVTDVLTHRVERSNLRITVTERGNLESQKTVDGICQLRGYSNKIIYIVEEGKTVQEGEVVVRFDSAEIDKEIAEQEIEFAQAESLVETTKQEVEVKINEGKSAVAAAQLELTLARLDLEKYEQGDYKVELSDLQGQIALAEVELERSRDAFENFKALVKKGFREPQQLKSEKQQVAYAEFNLERDKSKLRVLEDFTKKRQLTEFRAKAEEAERKLARAIATDKATVSKAKAEAESAKGVLAMERKNLDEWLEQRGKCEIKAEQTGVLAYANEDWYDSDRRIREGAIVYRRQKIFSLPDLKLMQVKVNVHESVVKKVKAGQKAKIRVVAFSNTTFVGTIKSVSQLADSSNSWRRGGVKEYTTIVTVDELPDIDIKPGMNAEVEILVDDLKDVIAVPVQAVTEHNHQHYAYVKNNADFDRVPVEVGESNTRMVQIVSGLEVGVEVALDARARGIIDFEGDDGFVDEKGESSTDPAEDEAAASDEASVESDATADAADGAAEQPDKASESLEKSDDAVESKDASAFPAKSSE